MNIIFRTFQSFFIQFIIYFPIYFVKDGSFSTQIGVYEIVADQLPNIIDEDGDVIDQNGVIIDLSASRVTYLDANSNDIVENLEYFMGTTGDDIFVGASRYVSQYQIQAFNASGGSDEIFGAETSFNPITNEVIDIKTVVDYSSMQGGQGAVFILDGSSVMSGVDQDGNLLYVDVKEAADNNWNDWLPYNESTLGENKTISTVSTYDTDKDGASVILDTFGDIDIAFNVDHYIGSDEADIFFGSNENDTFDAATGTGNYMSGGDGVDELIVNDYDEGEDDDLDLSSMEVGRAYSHQNYKDVDVSGGEFVSDSDNEHSGGNLYRIDFAEVNNLHSFFESNEFMPLTVFRDLELTFASTTSKQGSARAGLVPHSSHLIHRMETHGTRWLSGAFPWRGAAPES